MAAAFEPERLQTQYLLERTGRAVGQGKVEYKLDIPNNAQPGTICSVPPEMCGGIVESYVYVEIIAYTKDFSRIWSIQKRPIFVDYAEAAFYGELPEPVELEEKNGLLRVGHVHIPFTEQGFEKFESHESLNLPSFGTVDRFIQLMVPSAYSDGAIVDLGTNCTLTDALAGAEEWPELELTDVSREYTQDPRLGVEPVSFTSFGTTNNRDRFPR